MLILVSGLPGSGKSFFGQKLANSIGANYLNSDQVRTEIHTRGRYTDNDKLAVYEQMADNASKALEEGRDVVADATFYRRYLRQLFEDLAATYNTPVRIIEVRTDESTTRRRLSVARKYSEADFSVYEIIRDEFEGITTPHLVLTSTDNNIEEMLTKAMQYTGHERK